MATATMPSRWNYLMCLVPIAICTPIAFMFLGNLRDDVAALHRFVIPATHAMKLAPGDYIAYGETESIVAGKRYTSDDWQTECSLADSAGRPIALERVSARRSKYSIGDYSGSSFWAFEIPGGDTYTWSCTTTGGEGVLAVGAPFGSGIVKVVFMFLAGPLSAVFPFFVLLSRRRRAAWQAKQQAR